MHADKAVAEKRMRAYHLPPSLLKEFSPEAIEEMRVTFAMFDKSGDGALDEEELGALLRTFGQEPTQEKVRSITGRCVAFPLYDSQQVFPPFATGFSNQSPALPPLVHLHPPFPCCRYRVLGCFPPTGFDDAKKRTQRRGQDPQGDVGDRLRPVGDDRVPGVRHAHEKGQQRVRDRRPVAKHVTITVVPGVATRTLILRC